jgi:hypothetical protein
VTDHSSSAAGLRTDVLGAPLIAAMASEITTLCQHGLVNIKVTTEGQLDAQVPLLERLSYDYCRAIKSQFQSPGSAVRRFLGDGLRGFNSSRDDLDYAFVSRLSFGPQSQAQSDTRDRHQEPASGEGYGNNWARQYADNMSDYAIYLLSLVNVAKKQRRRLRRLLILGTALFLITVLSVRLPVYLSWPNFLIRLGCALGAAFCAWLFAKERYINELDSSSFRRVLGREVSLLPERSALSLQLRAGSVRPVEPLEAEIFALALINPAALRQRISERYEPERRTLRQRVTAEIQIPGELIAPRESQDRPYNSSVEADEEVIKSDILRQREKFTGLGRIPFPVIIPPKGELNDDMVVLGTDGEHIPCFSYSEYLLIIASVLRMLLLKAYQLKDVDHLPVGGSNAERQALGCIMQRGNPSDKAIETAADRILSLERADGDDIGIRDLQALKVAAELVRKLSGRYAIAASVECTPEGRVLLEYRRKMVPVLELGTTKGGRFRWLFDWASILLGARPVDLTVPLENAPTCESFHLYVDCPEGLYLRKQQLVGLDEYMNRSNRQGNTIPPYYRLRRRLGQPYAHFYARFFPAPNEGEVLPEFRVSFWEVPPGSLFRAAVVSVSTALLVWLVGWVLARVRNPATDVPAVLLAFPAVAAAWLGFDEKRRRLLEGTLVSRVSLMLSASSALMASALFMLNDAHLPALHDRIPFPIDISFLGINEGSWGVLVFVSLINALSVGYLCLLRTSEYKHLTARPDPMGAVKER